MNQSIFPSWLRVTLYVAAALGTAVLPILLHYGVLDQSGLTVWSALVAAISALAASHVSPGGDDIQDGTSEGEAGFEEGVEEPAA